jgi:glutamate-ammonia-ligase adenylyltransferase
MPPTLPPVGRAFGDARALADSERLLFAEELPRHEVEEILARYGFTDPLKADGKIQEMAGDPATRHALAPALPILLEALAAHADPDRTLMDFKRLADAYGGRENLYSMFAGDPRGVSDLAAVFAASQFFADTLVRWPHLTVLLFDRDQLLAPKSRKRLGGELRDALGVYETLDGALDSLRAFKRRELLRIGVRDLTGRADLPTTTAELSSVADVCVRAAYGLALEETSRVMGPPPPGGTFAVIAMGKLGGQELNYSSDIDLMFVYGTGADEAGPTPGREPSSATEPSPAAATELSPAAAELSPAAALEAAAHAFYARLATNLTHALAGHTGQGYAFRVDTDLRPEGRDGPLVRSLASYEEYYRRWASTWEFQALLKARPIAGDKDLGARFVAAVQPLVYRPALAPEDVARIRAMKERTEQQLEAKGEFHREVKLGFGGIRDIEFTVQLLQLAYGHDEPRLRTGSTLRALAALHQLALISDEDHADISRAYLFLRNVEHRLQIMQSLQQHTLPAGNVRLARFARRLGYEEGAYGPDERFAAEYRAHTSRVRRFFQQYFYAQSYDRGRTSLAAIVEGTIPPAAAADVLAPHGFRDFDRTVRSLTRLGAEAGRIDAQFLSWLDGALQVAGQTPDPDAALFHLTRFLAELGGGRQGIRMLAEGPFVLDLLLRVFGASEFLADELVRHPEFLDVLASPATAFADKPYSQVVTEIRAATAEAGDYEARLDALRRYKRRELLRIGARDLIGGSDVRTVSEELTRLADACLREAYLLARDRLAVELGEPGGSSFAVIGVGKLGSRELNYSSDLDVLFVYKGEGETGKSGDAAGQATGGVPLGEFWTRLAGDLMSALSAPAATGKAYDVDANLRPEGRNGQLVRSLASYTEYYERWARIWEFQALIRARPICGDVELAAEFMQMLQHLVYRERLADEDLAEIRHLKGRMETERMGRGMDPRRHVKLGPGGISDIEFIVQVLQLQHGRRVRGLRRTDTFEGIRQLAKHGLLTEADAKTLTRGLALLRRVELRLQIVRKRPEHVLPEDAVELGRLARRLGYQGDVATAGRLFYEDYLHATSAIREVFVRLLA